MKILNFAPGFVWASSKNENNQAKVSIAGESFWISSCEETILEGQPAIKGIVSNELLATKTHGIKEGDSVVFVPTLSEE